MQNKFLIERNLKIYALARPKNRKDRLKIKVIAEMFGMSEPRIKAIVYQVAKEMEK